MTDTKKDPTIIHESPLHRFRGMLQVAAKGTSERTAWRYELQVRLPFGLGWYMVHHLDVFEQAGKNLEDIERYLWAQACIGIARDVNRVTAACGRELPT